MEVREATTVDVKGIQRVAEASLTESYADDLGREMVTDAFERWYATPRLTDRLTSEDVRYYVLEEEGDVVAFSESELSTDGEVGELHWLHVHPDYRGQGYGTRLLDYTERDLLEQGAIRIEGYVLAANDAGNEFYQDHGYHRTGERTVSLDSRDVTERTYLKLPEEEAPAELTEPRTVDDTTIYVAFDERERGNKAPFYVAYSDPDRDAKYGFFCANCETVDNAMDTMERIKCNECGNTRKPSAWDLTYGG